MNEPGFDAVAWLVQVLRVVVPLGAAAQRERLIAGYATLKLSGRVMGYLSDVLYVIGHRAKLAAQHCDSVGCTCRCARCATHDHCHLGGRSSQ